MSSHTSANQNVAQRVLSNNLIKCLIYALTRETKNCDQILFCAVHLEQKTTPRKSTALNPPNVRADTHNSRTNQKKISRILGDNRQPKPDNEGGTVNAYVYHQDGRKQVSTPPSFRCLHNREKPQIYLHVIRPSAD